MTLIVAAIDAVSGDVHIAGDTKVTWDGDPTKSRRMFLEPALKVIRLSDDVAVGFAGEGPETIAKLVSALPPADINTILDGLCAIAGASFILAARSPARLWQIEGGLAGEVTDKGLAMIGDDAPVGSPAQEATVFQLVRDRYNDLPRTSAAERLHSAMQHILAVARPDSIGGHLVLLSAGDSAPFRYQASTTAIFEALFPGQAVERPLHLHVLPGETPTPGAVALWIENAQRGQVFCDHAPEVRHSVKASTREELAAIALDAHGQHLAVPAEDDFTKLIRLMT